MTDRMLEYTDALLQEAALYADQTTEQVETVYFGGGTPSLLPPPLLSSLMRGLRDIFSLRTVSEWTLEANPGTLGREWLDAALEGGMTRLSLGMQAAQNRILRSLGRIHSMEDTLHSVQMIRQAGVHNLNLDLIFGLPGQTEEDWHETLASACSMNPEHISAYGLIPEEGTPLWDDLHSGRCFLPDPDLEREMYDDLLTFLSEKGFQQYEISNFSLPGFACQHNIGYWTQKAYLGLGLSASSMLRISRNRQGLTCLRRTNTSQMDAYLQGIHQGKPVLSEESRIPPAETQFETMMLGLRMNRGVDEDFFLRTHGISIGQRYGEKLRKLQKEGLLYSSDGAWKLTRRGMDLQNTALVELMDP